MTSAGQATATGSKKTGFADGTVEGALIGVGLALPDHRTPEGRRRRCTAQFDEDAVTLAAEAAAEALDGSDSMPAALLLATTTPPYDEGGSAQVIAELLGLPSGTYVAELTATMRDGLGSVRMALALASAGLEPVLVCAAHRRQEGDEGDGAIALLIGSTGGSAILRSGPAHCEELRDVWRLAGDPSLQSSDSSFAQQQGPPRIARELADRVGDAPNADHQDTVRAMIVTPQTRSAQRIEKELDGPGDPAVARTGVLGAAHPLLRLVCGLESAGAVIVASGGLGEALLHDPGEGASEIAQLCRERAEAGEDSEGVSPKPDETGFEPYASAPRSWRERGQDLRLEGLRWGDEVHYPPPPVPPPGYEGEKGEVHSLARRGTVLTCTRDHIYPGAAVTTMAVVDLDGGGRFYGQVAQGSEVEIGDRVRLVPRRLHAGGGMVQYFWKVLPE